MNRTFRAALGRRLLMAALLVVLTGGTGAQATSTDAVAVATGTTTITATGTARVRLHFPKDTTIDMDAVQLIPGAGTTRAFVLLRPETQACGDPRIPLCIFTLLGWEKGLTPNLATLHAGDPAHNFVQLANNPPLQPAGAATVYFVADGPVTVRWHFSHLTGRSTTAARQKIHATAGALPGTCLSACRLDPTQSARMSYGGLSVPLRTQAFTYALAYLQKPPRFTASTGHNLLTGQAIACITPGHFDPTASTDPAKYLTGCNEPPKDYNEVRQAPGNITNCSSGPLIAQYCQIFNASSPPRVYFGYRSEYADGLATLPDEPHTIMGGLYLWIEYN